MRRWIWITISVLGSIVLLLAIGGPASEPAYRGKSLSVWLRGFESDVAEARWRSAEAMRQMGTNALPCLIARLDHRSITQESWWKRMLRAALSKQSLIKLNLPRSADERRETLAALDALGPAAKDAIPAVERLLHENPPDPQALLVLGRLGPEAVPALTRALTNDEKAIRFGARACLDMLESHSEILFPTTPQNAEFMHRTCEFNLQVINAAFRDYRTNHPEEFSPDGMPRPSLPQGFSPAEVSETNRIPSLPKVPSGYE